MARKTAEDFETVPAQDRVVRLPEVDTLEQVTALLYVLLNEHLPAKDIQEAIRKARGLIGSRPYYADVRLEAWARDLALKVLR